MDEDEVFERLLGEPSLLRLPLVRLGDRLAVGPDEDEWRSLIGSAG